MQPLRPLRRHTSAVPACRSCTVASRMVSTSRSAACGAHSTPPGWPSTRHRALRGRAAAGDEAFGRLLRQGIPDTLGQAIAELASFPR